MLFAKEKPDEQQEKLKEPMAKDIKCINKQTITGIIFAKGGDTNEKLQT